jgi:hypothetical protein
MEREMDEVAKLNDACLHLLIPHILRENMRPAKNICALSY